MEKDGTCQNFKHIACTGLKIVCVCVCVRVCVRARVTSTEPSLLSAGWCTFHFRRVAICKKNMSYPSLVIPYVLPPSVREMN